MSEQHKPQEPETVAEPGSVTELINAARNNQDSSAQEKLSRRYWDRLIALARSRLPTSVQKVVGPEDVANDVLFAFFDALTKGHCDRMRNRHDLWRYLYKLTANHCRDMDRRHHRRKRWPGTPSEPRAVHGEDSAFASGNTTSDPAGLDNMPDLRMPGPEQAVAFRSMCESLLARFTEREQQVFIMLLNGYCNSEMANKLDCVERTVERTLQAIRKKLGDFIDEGSRLPLRS